MIEHEIYLCPVHSIELSYVLRGGAGYYRDCCLYVQAAGVPMPALEGPAKQQKSVSRKVIVVNKKTESKRGIN
jgi:hypothetical protein